MTRSPGSLLPGKMFLYRRQKGVQAMTVSRLRIALLMAASALALAPDPATAGVEKRRGSSPDGLWTEVVRPPAFKESFAPSSPSPRAYRRFRVQPELLRELLERAPLESGVALPRRG